MNEALIVEVIRKTVTVDCAVEEAFRVFTAGALSWWPVETHSIHEDVDEIVFEPRVGGAVYEIGTSGERGHWATVLEWEPPHRLVLAWNILEREGDLTEVEVRFLPDGGATRVELEHRGWENVALDGPAKRGSYDIGWDAVLGKYVDRV
ncbi:MAG TPA: SRPBCC family protein [Gaiellaceae bacterium]|nr:SRPBCC family protein [Gaiellaceae bacterium]